MRRDRRRDLVLFAGFSLVNNVSEPLVKTFSLVILAIAAV